MLPALVRCSVAPELMVLPVSDLPHRADWAEIEQVFGQTPSRRAMLMTARARLAQIEAMLVPVAAVWVNGSFVTSVEEPSDIDIAFLINGPALPSMRTDAGLEPAEAASRVRKCMEDRYEPGGTATEHYTDFRGIFWYPEGHPHYLASVSELDYWSAVWSRVQVRHGGHTGDGPSITVYDDSKGFVEVRWSS